MTDEEREQLRREIVTVFLENDDLILSLRGCQMCRGKIPTHRSSWSWSSIIGIRFGGSSKTASEENLLIDHVMEQTVVTANSNQ